MVSGNREHFCPGRRWSRTSPESSWRTGRRWTWRRRRSAWCRACVLVAAFRNTFAIIKNNCYDIYVDSFKWERYTVKTNRFDQSSVMFDCTLIQWISTFWSFRLKAYFKAIVTNLFLSYSPYNLPFIFAHNYQVAKDFASILFT